MSTRPLTAPFCVALSLMLLIVTLTLPPPALAQDTEDATKNMERGSEAMARGDFKQAVVFFRAANALKPDASGPLLALGLALRASGECKEAIVPLEAYKKKKPTGGDPKADDALEYCKKQLEKPVTPPVDLSKGSAPNAQQNALQGQGTSIKTEEPPPKRFYTRWWFWTPIALAVAGGVAAGVVLSQSGGGKTAPASSPGFGPAQTAMFGR